MEKKNILKLIEQSGINPEDALFLRDKLSNSSINNENWASVIVKLIDEAIKKETDDFSSFRLEHIKYHITRIKEFEKDYVAEDDDFEEDFDETMQDNDPKRFLPKSQREIIEKAEKYIISLSKEDLLKEAFDFIVKTYPDIYESKDRILLSKGFKKYHKSIGVIQFFYLDEEPAEKLRYVTNNLHLELADRAYEFETNNIDTFLKEYLDWANKNKITKHTKQNIKLYLNQKRKKLTDLTIEKIKTLATTQ